MPENECLLLARSRRWQRVGDSFRQRESAAVTAAKAFDSLRRTIRMLRKLIPFEALINAVAAGNKDELHRLAAQCRKGHDYFEIIRRLGEKRLGRDAIIEEFLWEICDRFLQQILVSSFGPGLLQLLKTQMQTIRNELDDKVHALAEILSKNPNAALRMPRDKENPTVKLLNESLLPVPQK